ncbi:GSCOCG00001814001-RA-CDS [Cotesia congregata]|nr:GSCOCG00001814001-RA-CDS [Cotesia congregata]
MNTTSSLSSIRLAALVPSILVPPLLLREPAIKSLKTKNKQCILIIITIYFYNDNNNYYYIEPR